MPDAVGGGTAYELGRHTVRVDLLLVRRAATAPRERAAVFEHAQESRKAVAKPRAKETEVVGIAERLPLLLASVHPGTDPFLHEVGMRAVSVWLSALAFVDLEVDLVLAHRVLQATRASITAC
jgi:hypothetical protein